MSMYRFSLESLLQHRKFIEESKQKDLSLVQRQLSKELESLSGLKDRQVQAADDLRNRGTNGIRSYEFSMYRDYSSRLRKEIEKQQKVIEKLEIKVTLARTELLSAVKECKKLEKLKENQKKNYERKRAKKEQLFINEAAVVRFNRKDP